jgi:NAD(P)-dependent dehydrogenase (short-subunit alcohol dehydrogenase family)
MRVADAIALVTGGASGLGEATVREILGGGGRAAILDRPNSKGEALAKELGERALFAAADVTSERGQARSTRGEAVPAWISVMVNCADRHRTCVTVGRSRSSCSS